jgi:superfamily I DNA/RNA helicase
VLIEKNTETGHRSSRKRVFSNNDRGEKIIIVFTDQMKSEVQYVSNRIEELRKHGVRYIYRYFSTNLKSYKEMAVLCRVRRNILADFILELKSRKIPVVKLHGKALADRIVAKDILAYLSLITNKYDNEAFKTAYNCPKVGVSVIIIHSAREEWARVSFST